MAGLARFGWKGMAIAGALTALASAASAHPHVLIESWSDVVFDDKGMIAAINVEWAFDEMYSEAAIDGLDANGDGFYSAGELDILSRENLAALKDYSYFTYAKADGEKVEYEDVTEYGQILNGKILKMYFQIPLKTPVDPRKVSFSYKIYDPSFYIAIDFSKSNPLTAVGEAPAGCKVELLEVTADQQAEETRQWLATKDTEWQPETEEDFGALFAQPVEVACAPKTALN